MPVVDRTRLALARRRKALREAVPVEPLSETNSATGRHADLAAALRACPTTSSLVRTLKVGPSASPASHAARRACDVVAVTDVQQPGEWVIVFVDAVGVHAHDGEEACSRLALNLDLDRCWTGGELHREIRAMELVLSRDGRGSAAGAPGGATARSPGTCSGNGRSCSHVLTHAQAAARAQVLGPIERTAQLAGYPTRAAPAAVATNSDPSPCVMRTVRTIPAAARRRAWSYATARPQPITRRHGSSGDAPTLANHSRPSRDLGPGATDARLTGPASNAPRPPHQPRSAQPAGPPAQRLSQLPILLRQHMEPPNSLRAFLHPS
jgi:hypothetical protein